MRKYHNCKTIVNGIAFDSKKEAKRYKELHLLEKSGIITNLELQKKYVLIPSQREECDEIYVGGKHKGEKKKGKVIEKECSYYADFVYLDKNGNVVVEDRKGIRTEAYKIKRKLMLHIHGIRIKET